MFASAYGTSSEYTRPIVISSRRVNGTCDAGIGTFVVINDEGWIVTAWHIIDQIMALGRNVELYNSTLAKREAISNDTTLNSQKRHQQLNSNRILPDMVTNMSTWCSYDSVSLVDISGIPEIDLAIARLEGFDKTTIKHYPVFKDPYKSMENGTSLCKLGFPFHSVQPTFDEASTSFRLPVGSFPMPFFPLEGIYTRTVLIDIQPKPYQLKYVETSSPGLRGQSGGPTFDIHGNIWAIQSSTQHLNLGFGGDPKFKSKDNLYLQNQYFHVGWGIHSESIVGYLKEKNINFQISSI